MMNVSVSTKTVFRTVFLSITAVGVFLEVFASVDGNPNTEPWTHLVVDHVPSPLALAFFLYLGAWLVPHFRDAYRKRGKVKASPVKKDARNRATRTLLQGFVAAFLTAAADAATQALETAASGAVDLDFRRTAVVTGLGALTAGLMAGLSYLHRAVLDPSSIPSATPPPR